MSDVAWGSTGLLSLLSYYLAGEPKYPKAWDNSLLKLNRHLGVGGSPLSGHKEEIMREGQTPDRPYEYCSTFYCCTRLPGPSKRRFVSIRRHA